MIVEVYISKVIENGTAFGYVVGGERDGDTVFLPSRTVPVNRGEGDIVEVFTVTNRDDPTGRSRWIAVGPVNAEVGPEGWELEEEDQGRAFTAQDVVDHVKAAEAPLRVGDLELVFRAITNTAKKHVYNAVRNAHDTGTLARVEVRKSGTQTAPSAVYYCDSVDTAHDFLSGE